MRNRLKLMFAIHVAYCVIDVIVFGKFISLAVDCFYGWMAYYNIMKLNKCTLYTYMAFLAVTVPLGALGVFFALFNGFWTLILYPLQLVIYGYAAYHLYNFHKEFEAGKEYYEYVKEHGEPEDGQVPDDYR